MSRYVASRRELIERRLARGGKLTRAERTELWSTGRMIDSAVAQLQMLAEDDVFSAKYPGLARRLYEEGRGTRLIAETLMAEADGRHG